MLLAEHGHDPQAVALAIIGTEEFAKALVYAVAAIRIDQRSDLPQKIDAHVVKHRIAGWAEGAQIAMGDWAAVIRQESGGLAPTAAEWFQEMILMLADPGLPSLVGRDAKDAAQRERKMIATEFPGTLFGSAKKDAALYVDLTQDGEVLTPARLDDNDSYVEVAGLKWFLDYFAGLPDVIADDAAWTLFASQARGRLGIGAGSPAP